MEDFKTIETVQGDLVKVDVEDYDKLKIYKWYTSFRNTRRYASAVRTVQKADGSCSKQQISMHRFILNAKKIVDHINHDGLDNRKINLRECSNRENSRNSRKAKNRSSKYKGVCLIKKTKRWGAYIKLPDKLKHLGIFGCEKGAAAAYNKAAIKYFGEFAHLNVII